MMERQIISKGEYKHYQIDNFVSVKQYIFLKADGKKCLTLRFTNSLGYTVNAFKFVLAQIDVQGNVIKKKKIKLSNLVFESGTDYTSDKGIIVDEKCVDFKIQMLCVYSDRYRYKLKNDKIALYFVPHKEWNYDESDDRQRPLKVVSKTKFKVRSVKFVALLVIAALILLAFSPVISYYTKIIAKNLKKKYDRYKAKKAAEKAAAELASLEQASILEEVTYGEQE